MSILTPHNSANKGDFAKTVLMPGDPLRAKFIADTFLTDVRQVNGVRGMLGFTGKYNGKEISVMGSGRGMPSIGIYSYELFTQYDVDRIIRIGSAGSYSKDLKVYDVVLVTGAVSESSYAYVQSGYDKDGTCVRDYIHVTDLAQAHILAVKYLMEGNESNIFNLGNGVGFTVKEVIETARKVTGKPIKAVEEGRRAGDPAVLIASSEKAKNILGWKPEHANLEEIIASAWKWHSSHPQGYCSVQKEDK